MYGETYIVWVIGSKTPCEKEMLTEMLGIVAEIKIFYASPRSIYGVY